MGVHVNITVLVNALFAEWASMVKPTVLVNAFFAEYRRFVQPQRVVSVAAAATLYMGMVYAHSLS